MPSGYWQPYEHFVSTSLHTQSNTIRAQRAETYTVEVYNSLLRHGLARLKRKTKCYSKSQDMLECSVKLFMAYWNNGKAIFI
ncbi:MAG: hypothetical protein ABL933_13935 [Methyloglobulus sp.]|nr:IS1 family transposase [Methyloglobulus sp.]